MRVRTHGARVLLGQRPFQGSTVGASLYLGVTDPAYRRNRVMSPNANWFCVSTTLIDPGAASVQKCLAVAQVTSPTTDLNYTLPADLQNGPLALDVRTFVGDYENESIYRQALTATDGGGDLTGEILGTANILGADKRDGGGVRVRFTYSASLSGLQPTQFALVQTSGPGSLADAVVDAVEWSNSIDVDGLTDATAYGWRLEGRNGSVTADLGSVTFTADAAGPADPTGVVAVPL